MKNNEQLTIHIDSSGSEKIQVALMTVDNRRYVLDKSVSHVKAQEVLPMIEDLLAVHNLKIENVVSIRVNTGPGSYTGLRVGVAIANMLGVLLGVPINGLPVGQQVFPVYEGDRYTV